MTEIHNFLGRINQKTKVFTVHGAEGSCEHLAKWTQKNLGIDAQAPKSGDTYHC